MVKLISDEPDFNVTELFMSPCGRIFIADGFSNIEIYDTFSGNKVFSIDYRASVPLILSSDLMMFSFQEAQGRKLGETELRLVNFQYNGFTKSYRTVHLLSMPMNLLDADTNKRVFIGDPDDQQPNELSVWYTNPYTKLLLHINTGKIRTTSGKGAPVIIKNVAYELKYKEYVDHKFYVPGMCTLHRTDLKTNKCRRYDIDKRISLDSGFRICLD